MLLNTKKNTQKHANCETLAQNVIKTLISCMQVFQGCLLSKEIDLIFKHKNVCILNFIKLAIREYL